MENKVCKKCGLVKTPTGFKPSVGRELDSQSAFNLVCQYSGDSPECLNTTKSYDSNSDNWNKRLGDSIK
jgi:hypothetical protein